LLAAGATFLIGKIVFNWQNRGESPLQRMPTLKLARLPGLRYHDLRRRAATKVLGCGGGLPMATVAQTPAQPATAAIRMTRRCNLVQLEALRRTLEYVATAMLGEKFAAIRMNLPQ